MLSLFLRRTSITFSLVEQKLPSIPLTSIAFRSILVRRKGTYNKVLNISKQICFYQVLLSRSKLIIWQHLQSEASYFFRELLPVHWSFETVPKINVQDFTTAKQHMRYVIVNLSSFFFFFPFLLWNHELPRVVQHKITWVSIP